MTQAEFYAWWHLHVKEDDLEYAQFRVTADQLKNLLAAPVELLPPPGAGMMWHLFIVPVFIYKFGGVAFGNLGTTSLAIYQDAIGGALSFSIPATDLLDAAADTTERSNPNIIVPSLTADLENVGVFLSHNNDGGTGEYTLGDGELFIHVDYHRVVLP